ncbi:MAG: mechanosensitive ion channel family protein [Nitrospirae bacterium]|nr:mechanosensitive ion channel family protein [Nitrospirota bacterium]
MRRSVRHKGNRPVLPLTRSVPIILVFFLLFAVLTGRGLAAQSGTPPVVPSEQAIETAPVIIDDMTLFSLRGTQSYPAAERAAAIADRIRQVAADKRILTASLTVAETEYSTDIMAGEGKIVSIVDADAAADRISRQVLARVYLAKIRSAIEKYRQDRSPESLGRGTGYSLLVAIGFIAALIVLRKIYQGLYSRLESRYKSRVHALHIQSLEFVRVERVWTTITGALKTIRIILTLVIFYVCFHLVLGFFPWTRLLAAHLLDYVMKPVLMLGKGILNNIPNLLFIAVLTILTRYFLKLMKLFFTGIETKTLIISGFDPDWARPTYKIMRLLVIVFAVIVAYPYIPGSESPAFKGISLFIGVVFSLGSSSAISNIIAGYMLTYRRTFKVGDRVKIDEYTGDVTEIRLQVTHLRTVKNEEIIVPNSAILAGHVVNYSTFAREHGLILHTTVGIGYEVPWRQVEAMLKLAAERTSGLLKEPQPFVLQKSLGDFAVTYELNVYIDDPHGMTTMYSELHKNVLDAFNEYGIQIMTPAYEGDPDEAKLVPKEKWFAAPAKPLDDVTKKTGQ